MKPEINFFSHKMLTRRISTNDNKKMDRNLTMNIFKKFSNQSLQTEKRSVTKFNFEVIIIISLRRRRRQ